MRVRLEVCVEDAAGIEAALAGGADRIELCAALAIGGLTPSLGLMRLAAAATVPVVALIRPRDGDFRYDKRDQAVIADDIAAAAEAGLAGIAIGASDCGGLDRAVLHALIAHAHAVFLPRRPTLTLHRAADLAPDADALVEDAVALGFDRILTSGGAARALDGAARLGAMVRRACGRIAIMAGGGVEAATVRELVARTGVDEVHASARTAGPVEPRLVELGFAAARGRRTDAATVAALRMALSGT